MPGYSLENKGQIIASHTYHYEEGSIILRKTLQVLETTCSILWNTALAHTSSDMEDEISTWLRVEIQKFCIRSRLKLLRRLNQ